MTGYQSKRAAAQGKLDSVEREALKLALEALITITDAIYVNSQQEADAVYKANDAITAIKEALAQPAQEPWPEEPFGHMAGGVQPPQRPWVGLTDEDMKKSWYDMENIMGWYSFQEVARAIEAKLKERNA
jgi:hypothetical protein